MIPRDQQKILIDAGRSAYGWSFWGPSFKCMQLFYQQTVLNNPTTQIPKDPLTKGSMGHVWCAHYFARTAAATKKGIWYSGRIIRDPDEFYEPDEAVEAWLDRNPEANGYPHLEGILAACSDYRRKNPPSQLPEVVAIEAQVVLALGYKDGLFGLWLDEDLEGNKPGDGQVEYATLDCPELVVPHRNVPFLKHGEPIRISKRFDAVVRINRINYIDDHKFTSVKPYPNRAHQYRMDGQFAVNTIAGRQLWPRRFGGVRLRFIMNRPPYNSKVFMVEPAQKRDAAFAKSLYRKAHEVAGLLRTDKVGSDWPMAMSDLVCWHRYGKCSAFNVCTGR